MKIRLSWKLTAVFGSATIIGLLTGILYLSTHLRTYLDANLEASIRRELLLGRDLLETHIRDRAGLPDASALAGRIGLSLGMRVTIIDLNGKVTGDSELDALALSRVENHADRPEVRDAIGKGFGKSRRYSYTLRKYLLYAAMPFGGERPAGVLRLALPLTEVELFERSFLKMVLFAMGLVLLLSLVLTFVLAGFVSRPLCEMAEIAQAMARGDFSRKPSVVSRDEIGELAGAVTHMSDEIESMLGRLRREGEKLDAVLSSMSEGVMVVSEKGEILLMNPSLRKTFLVDMPTEGRRPAEVIRNVAVLDIVSRLLSGKDVMVSEEITLPAPEGRTCKVNAVAIHRAGRFDGAVLVMHDISELRRLEKIRQDFVANVSHELRTPVASIKGYAETLLDGALEDKDHAREFVGVIRDNSDRLASLINDLLDLARIESGKMPMVFMPVELRPIVERCLGILESLAARKSLRITVEIPDSLPKLNADEARISQVILNLLDNAVKYTPDGGEVRVRALQQENKVCVEVEDTGVGIPEADLPRIFERFYRVDKARSRELGGTGLGLSIVKHIVHAHGGEVSVISTPGRGSQFSFTVPLA
ncbi:MAG: HAMP domain-containing protein [Candidatus Omnitrophica bacterium]|nr:HAMP domain-containing protein [Candidatus Omnitrophota bacterium]